jgi:hypothetical protein
MKVWTLAAAITSRVESKTEIKKRKDYMRSQWAVRDLNSYGFCSLLFRYDIELHLTSARVLNEIFADRLLYLPVMLSISETFLN